MRWEDPVPAQRGPARLNVWIQEAQELRRNPGRWALLTIAQSDSQASNLQQAVAHGKLVAWRPDGAFEATVRTIDGKQHVYARYVGE